MTVFYIILILTASFILVKGADLMINSLKKIGKFFRWSPFILSFIFVAVATSLPEIFIGITSAIHKIPSLSLGNVIGANIINLTLILGLCAIITSKIKFSKATRNETFLSFLVSFFPILLALDGKLSRFDGIALLALFIIYLIFIFLKEKRIPKEILDAKNKQSFFKNFIFLILGLILLIGSAEIIIRLTQALATNLKLPFILIGLVLISLGTTLPELAFGVRAALKKQEEFSLGTSLGTIVANSCLALGIAVIIFPVEIVAFSTFLIASFFFFLTIIIFIIFIKTREELSRIEGIFLVLFFIVFLVVQFLTSR